MASTLVDLVKISAASTGTGAIKLGSPVAGYRGVEALTNGKVYSYSIQDGDAWEFGQGTYLSATGQLIRTPDDSSDGGAAINLRQNAQIAFVALSSDLDAVRLSNDALAAAEQTQSDAAQTADDRVIVTAAAGQVVSGAPPYPTVYGGALPYGVNNLSSAGIGTGTGGTPGTYSGGVSGGPAHFAWTYTIGSDGKIASYAITNPGLASTNSAPTLSYPSGSVTGATPPVATVASRVLVGESYWAVSADGLTDDLWSNNGTSTPAAVLDSLGNQIKVYNAAGMAAQVAEAAALVDPLTAIGANMSATARALSSVSIGAMTTAGTSNNTDFARTRDSATIPVRARLDSVTLDVTVDASVTVIVMEPAWRNTGKAIAVVTTALPAGDGRTVELGGLIVPAGTLVFVRLNSGTLRSDAAASVLEFTWAGFGASVGSTATIAAQTGAFGMTVHYAPLIDEIDTNASASAAIDRMSDPIALADVASATGSATTATIAASADAGAHIAAGSILTGWETPSLAIPNDGTQADTLILLVYEKATSEGDIDTTGAFQSAGRPVRVVRKTCAELGLTAGADPIPVSIPIMPFVAAAGKSYTYVLIGRRAGSTLGGKFIVATSGTAPLQRRRGWWTSTGSSNTYAGLASSSFAAGLTYVRERAAGDPPSAAALAAWDAATIAISAAIQSGRVTGLQQPTAAYNLHLVAGQSLAAAGLTRYALSVTAKLNNKMLGGNVRPALEDGSTYPTFGAAAWNDMVAVPKYANVLYDNATVTSVSGAQGEPWNLAWLNSAKAYFNEHVFAENDARIFCTINTAIGAKTIEQLSKVNDQDGTNRWGVLTDGFTKAKAAAGASSIYLTAVAFGQGENDYDPDAGSVNRTRALYKAKLATYFDDIQAEAVTRFGQARPAAIFTYCTSGVFVSDTDANGDPDLFVSMAQLELSNERADTFMVGAAAYPYPELVGTWHQTANAARWYGEMLAKVTDHVLYKGQDWKPVQPLWIRKFGNAVYAGFHAPVAPLVFQDPYFTSDYPDGYPFTNHGFKLIDRGNGNASVASTASLAGKAIVKFALAGDTTDDLLVVAGPKGPVANGNGHVCLRDSDPALGKTSYLYDTAYMDTAERLDALAGKPYPLWNWCVVGSWPVGYTADFIEWDDSAISGSANALAAPIPIGRERVVSTDYAAKDGDVLAVDTSAGPVTITAPDLGGTFVVRDFAATFATNNCTITGNGASFNGDATLVLDVSGYEINAFRQSAETEWRWTAIRMNGV